MEPQTRKPWIIKSLAIFYLMIASLILVMSLVTMTNPNAKPGPTAMLIIAIPILMIISSVGLLMYKKFGLYLGIVFAVLLIIFFAYGTMYPFINPSPGPVRIGLELVFGLIISIGTLAILIKHRRAFD